MSKCCRPLESWRVRISDLQAQVEERDQQLAAVVEALGKYVAIDDGSLGPDLTDEDVERIKELTFQEGRNVLADIPAAGAKLERAEKLAEALEEGWRHGRTTMDVKALVEGHTTSCRWYPAPEIWECSPDCAALREEGK